MLKKIGFENYSPSQNVNHNDIEPDVYSNKKHIKRSVVRVYFEQRDRDYVYYNDKFDLHFGDLVYVDGKLAGQIGRVIDLTYNFKVNLKYYKKVIAHIDTSLHGKFYTTGSHILSFDRKAMPWKKIKNWYFAPESEDDEIITGSDDSFINISEIDEVKITKDSFEKGIEIYSNKQVIFICLENMYGHAIINDHKMYEVEFTYKNGVITELNCDCFCSDICQHQLASLYQLKSLIEFIENNYKNIFDKTKFFSAIANVELFKFAIELKKSESFEL